MKRVLTGFSLGIGAILFIFFTTNLIFKLSLYALLAFSIYELLKHKITNNFFSWIILGTILVNIFLVNFISESFPRSFFFTVILISAFTDIFALAFGKLIGRSYIYPNISPNKTLEGTLSGLFLPATLSILFSYLFLEKSLFGSEIFHNYLIFDHLIDNLGYLLSFTLIVACSFGSIVGDLIASKAKRLMKIKDFGNVLPGHGGIIDRIDSHLFCIPIFLFFNILFL